MMIVPDVFWSMSINEWMLASKGFSEFHSSEEKPNDKKPSVNKNAMSPERMRQLMEADDRK